MNVILAGTSASFSNRADFSCQRIKLVSKRQLDTGFQQKLTLADHVHEFDVDQYIFGGPKSLEVQHFAFVIDLIHAALLAPLLSMVTFSGIPLAFMDFSKNRRAAALSRLAVSRKSTVLPSLSTAW